MNDITKELAETLKELRTKFDARQHLSPSMVRVDAILDRYEDACKPKMTINLKDYEGKFVVVTLRNEWRIVSTVYTNLGYTCYPYSIDRTNYSNDGRVLIGDEHPCDIIDIKLVDEDPCETLETSKPSMTNCVVEGEPPNGCRAWNVWYEEYGSRGILNNLKISSLNDKPEPVITRVEVITDTGRDYVCWEDDNVITTSLQDNGKTLKIFVNTKTTQDLKDKWSTLLNSTNSDCRAMLIEPMETMITKPTFHIEPEVIEDLWNTTANYKTFAKSIADMMSSSTKETVSNQWATALSGLIDELGGDSPALWEWEGKTPTPEKVVECLRENIQYIADGELEACCAVMEMNEGRVSGNVLRAIRRPKPTLKSQALKDFETVRKHSDLLPEILDTIENALKSLPE